MFSRVSIFSTVAFIIGMLVATASYADPDAGENGAERVEFSCNISIFQNGQRVWIAKTSRKGTLAALEANPAKSKSDEKKFIIKETYILKELNGLEVSIDASGGIARHTTVIEGRAPLISRTAHAILRINIPSLNLNLQALDGLMQSYSPVSYGVLARSSVVVGGSIIPTMTTFYCGTNRLTANEK